MPFIRTPKRALFNYRIWRQMQTLPDALETLRIFLELNHSKTSRYLRLHLG
jgi:hypothetical protein